MLYDIFFSPVADAIATTRAFTEPGVSTIAPGTITPASKLWFALSQIPTQIVNDAIFAALSSIAHTSETEAPTVPAEPEAVPFPEVPPAKPRKENLYADAINALADSVVLGEPAPATPELKEPQTLEEYVDLDLNSDTPVEELRNGGFWKASVDRPQIGIGWKTYRTKSDARYYGKQAELWAVDWRVIKLDTGWKLQAAYIERDRWEKVVSGALTPRRSTEKPKRERLTETMESRKAQLELEPIAELREKFRRALVAGFHPSFSVSTISRDHLVKALVEAAEWDFSRVA